MTSASKAPRFSPDDLYSPNVGRWALSRWRVGPEREESWTYGVVAVAVHNPGDGVCVSLGWYSDSDTIEGAMWVERVASAFEGVTEIIARPAPAKPKVIARLPSAPFEPFVTDLRRSMRWHRVARATVPREGAGLDRFGLALYTYANRLGWDAVECIAERVVERCGGGPLPSLDEPPRFRAMTEVFR